jgi:hypothetical protein
VEVVEVIMAAVVAEVMAQGAADHQQAAAVAVVAVVHRL